MSKPPDASPAPAYDAWADYYDIGEGDRSRHLDFYLALCGPGIKRVLEIGCGTGVIASAIADRLETRADGPWRVAGLDISAPMLRIARARDPRVDWNLGDMRTLEVPGEFDLAFCCFHTYQLLADTAELTQSFMAARARMAPGGRFAFDVYQPNLDYLAHPRLDTLSRELVHAGRRLQIREDAHYDPERRSLELDWRMLDPTRPGTVLARTHFSMRQFSPLEVDNSLAAAGLEVVARYGDLDCSDFGPRSRRQVLVCAAQRDR